MKRLPAVESKMHSHLFLESHIFIISLSYVILIKFSLSLFLNESEMATGVAIDK